MKKNCSIAGLTPISFFGVSATYFESNLLESERDAATSGAEVELQVHAVTLATPTSGNGPRSIKFGKVGYGFGGSYTSAKIIDGGDTFSDLYNKLVTP